MSSPAEERAYQQGLREGQLCQEDRQKLQLLEFRCQSLTEALRAVAGVAAIHFPAAAGRAKEMLDNYTAWDDECERRRLLREAQATPAERILEGRR